jgi:hypothetical protein
MPSANALPRKPPGRREIGKARVLSPSADIVLGRACTIGERIVVFAIGQFGPAIEGTAVIEALTHLTNRYLVRFDGDPIVRFRFVHPDWQASPDQSLALLQECWRSSRDSDPLSEDFFPDTSNWHQE